MIVLKSITSKIPDLPLFSEQNEVWEKPSAICKVLESEASLTECQSGSKYETFSIIVMMTVKSFQMPASKFRSIVENNDSILTPLAQNMVDKLMKYDAVLYNQWLNWQNLLTLALNPNFSRLRYFTSFCGSTVG